ncbi:TonB-dependent receptor plug domain-containing protein [Frateuria aurantia]
MKYKKIALSLAGLALTPLAAALYAQPSTGGTPADASPQSSDASATSKANPEDKDSKKSSGKQLSTVVVTGSALPQIDVETASPVQTLTAQDIQRSGLTTVSDVLRSLSADNSGSIPNAFGNGFAAGASGVALRGLTVNSTLVLVDGLRNASYAASDDGQRSFVDLNTLPLAAVDHIDILKDGASSLYGADAIAGVVNIVLKRSYQGMEGTADIGTSEHGGGLTHKASLLLGGGDLDKDGYNAYLAVQYEKDDPIYNRDRGYPYNTTDLSGHGGVNSNAGIPGNDYGSTSAIVAPVTSSGTVGAYQPLSGCGAGTSAITNSAGTGCQQSLGGQYGEIQPQQEQGGLYFRFTKKFSDTMTGYAAASYFQNKTWVQGSPAQIQNSTPVNTDDITLPAVLNNGQLDPYDPWASKGEAARINYAFGDIPVWNSYDNHNERVVLGLDGEMGEWNYSASLVANHTFLNSVQEGLISYTGLMTAIDNGLYNFADPSKNSAAVRNLIAPGYTSTGTSNLDEADFSANRQLWELPGGDSALALGAQVRHESQNDPNFNPNDEFEGLGEALTEGHRNVAGTYFEFDAPLLNSLDMDISGRFDHYSDFGNNFAPKIGLKWKPLDWLALRGTYSTGFRAPSFAEGGSSSSTGFTTYDGSATPQSFIDAHGGDNGTGYLAPYSLAEVTTSNPNLRPETANSFTLGAVFQPADWMTISLDYYNIKKHNVITTADTGTALADYFASGKDYYSANGVTVIGDAVDPAHPTAQARPVEIISEYINADSLKTDGLDLDITSHLPFSNGWQWISDLSATDVFTWTEVLPDGTRESFAGTHGPYDLSSGAGTPKIRASFANTLVIHKLQLTGTFYYTSSMSNYAADAGEGALYEIPYDGRIGSFTYFNLVGSYDVSKDFSVTASVMNLFDKKAPIDPANYAAVNYNPTYAEQGAIGRFFNLGVKFKLK